MAQRGGNMRPPKIFNTFARVAIRGSQCRCGSHDSEWLVKIEVVNSCLIELSVHRLCLCSRISGTADCLPLSGLCLRLAVAFVPVRCRPRSIGLHRLRSLTVHRSSSCSRSSGSHVGLLQTLGPNRELHRAVELLAFVASVSSPNQPTDNTPRQHEYSASTSATSNLYYNSRCLVEVQMEVSLSEGDADCRGSESDTYEEFNRADEGGAVADDKSCELEDLAGLSVDDILKKVWVSIENAYEFYRRFGKMHGFGVRKGDSGKYCEGNLVRYRFFCNKEGLREHKHYDRVNRTREHKPETRTNCKAMLSVF
ncbi:hypothetical protein Ahy_B06g084186 [Arachis hypogaea]|uniref:FAR1 domain-containing protein n=1 Tax=Arachis hypogaea TaxID=3818 RepID=A0A444YRC3_ARAHY|nr:hypothetical protein Ahy_B06g084186 [Arachis hypogaea]